MNFVRFLGIMDEYTQVMKQGGTKILLKTVFKLEGDVQKFLKTVTSNDLNKPLHAFLDRFGKVVALADIAISGNTAIIIIEAAYEKDFVAHFTPYLKLSKMKMSFLHGKVVHVIGAHELGTIKIPKNIGYVTLLENESEINNIHNISDETYTVLRIENNIPVQGIDFDHPMFLETGLTDAVSLTKGCYPGQEIIARVTRLGKPARRLVRIGYESIPSIVTQNDQEVGNITSCCYSPKFDRFLVFATVKSGVREIDKGIIV